MSMNMQWCLLQRPKDEVGKEHYEIRSTAKPEPGLNEVLVRNIYLLVPPSMRLWMNEDAPYFDQQPLGSVMIGLTLGIVEASNDPAIQPGTYVNGMGGCQHWFVTTADQLRVVRPHPDVPLDAYRTVLSMQGLTAYGAMTEICRPVSGETMVVTAAASSVGSLVCQIGKKMGLKVVGIAGGPDKCAWLVNECGIDAAIDYKAEDVGARLDALCPEGIDIAFENVGGALMDLVLDRINQQARIALCGMVSHYNGQNVTQQSKSLMQLVNKSARMEGFLSLKYIDRYTEVEQKLQAWILDGSLQYQTDIIDGLENLTVGMQRVSKGLNHGLQIVRLSDDRLVQQ